MKAFTVFRVVFAAFMLLILAGILWPVGTCGPEPAVKSECRATMNSLVQAMKSYRTDYGHFPVVRADGRYETAADNARLLRVLLGKDDKENSYRVVYFEARPAKPRSKRGGLNPQGALVDPWGHPYKIRVNADPDARTENPYSDGEPFLPGGADVVAWSVGKDGILGSAKERNKLAESDDIVSWQ